MKQDYYYTKYREFTYCNKCGWNMISVTKNPQLCDSCLGTGDGKLEHQLYLEVRTKIVEIRRKYTRPELWHKLRMEACFPNSKYYKVDFSYIK